MVQETEAWCLLFLYPFQEVSVPPGAVIFRVGSVLFPDSVFFVSPDFFGWQITGYGSRLFGHVFCSVCLWIGIRVVYREDDPGAA